MFDVHNTCLAVAIISVLVSCTVIWSSFTSQEHHMARQEREVRRLLAQLQVNQTARVSSMDKSSQSREALQFVSSSLPWLVQPSTLQNYFSRGYYLGPGKYHQKYTHSVMSILTQFQDVDGRFAGCLRDIASDHRQAVSPEMTFEGRYLWDVSGLDLYRYKHKYRLHYGAASFSLCGGLGLTGGQGCGHVLIMQDPIRRAMAKYSSCQAERGNDPGCRSARAPGISIVDWIVSRGNPVFNSFVFNSALCAGDFSSNQSDAAHTKSSRDFPNPQDACERNLQAFLANVSSQNVTNVLAYIINNIDAWFTMVGLYEHLADTLAMLHHVTRFPLHQCPQLSSAETLDPKMAFSLGAQGSLSRLPPLPALLKMSQSDVALLSALSLAENHAVPDLTQPESGPEQATSSGQILPDVDVVNFNEEGDNRLVNFTGDSTLDVDSYVDAPLLLGVSTGDYLEDLGLNDTGAAEDDDAGEADDGSEKDVVTGHEMARRHLETNRPGESLYDKLSRDHRVLKALSLDLQIYRAVKTLYRIQSRMFFNSHQP